MSKNANEATKIIKKTITENIKKYFADKSPKFLINVLLFLKKIGIIKAGDIVLKIGGTVWGLDKLYLFVFRDSIFANKEILDLRTRNELRATINSLLGYEKEVNEYLMSTTLRNFERLSTSGDNLTDSPIESSGLKISETPDTSYIKEVLAKLNAEKEKKIKDYEISIKAPSMSEISSGKKVLKLNQKGDSVKEIQKMLYEIGYDYLITNFETLENWNDGIYGKGTKSAVETFQEDNDITPVDGVIGNNTLRKLKEVYTEKINNDKKTNNNEQ